MRDGKADAAGAGAQIQDPRVLRQIRDGHRVVTRDQDVRRHRQLQSVEAPFAKDVGQRLSLKGAGRILLHPLGSLLGGVQLPVRHQRGGGFSGRKSKQLARDEGSVLALRRTQRTARFQIKLAVPFYHRSLPFSSGMTSSSALMATSIMESSGSFVVKYWNHMPGAESARVSQLS